MIKTIVKACCGNQVTIYQPGSPIRKFQVRVFKENGYSVPDNFYNAGIFYVFKGSVIATASFGTSKISVRAGKDQAALTTLIEFESLLEQAVLLKQ